MYLYVFSDSVTGEMQQPFLAHNDEEAIRISRLAFSNVPPLILHDLYVARVRSYSGSDGAFDLDMIYRGVDYDLEDEVIA